MMNGFYNFCFDQTRLASMSARHGELMFLHQWVSATSAFEDLGRLNSLAGELLAMASCVRLGLPMAHGRRVETWTFCLSSPWSCLWARRGELTFAFLHVFFASKVSRRAFSYKELALDVKSIIEWFFSICELFTG